MAKPSRGFCSSSSAFLLGRLSNPAVAIAICQLFIESTTLKNVTLESTTKIEFHISASEENVSKNRYEDKIPYNHTRVRLRPGTYHGSDYINASFIDGYRQKGAYIATQGPLPHTVNDFWRMIWEHECRCIVMLCKCEEDEEEMSHFFWPQSKEISITYESVTVTLEDIKTFTHYIIRKLVVSKQKSSTVVTTNKVTITMFQYLNWPKDSVPNTTSTILEIVNLIQKVQMKTANKPIIVVCNDGMGRTGTFITIHAQMERLKSEGVMDIFQFIKSSRFQRAYLVADKDQYQFCYQVLADFLDKFDTYANFKELI